MTDYKMLGEVICYCGTCKLELNHRITLMDGAEPSRVLCLTCHKEHRFKKAGPSERKVATVKRAATPKDLTKARENIEESKWKSKLHNPNRSTIPYSINTEFENDQLVMHPKFGVGLVVGFEYPDKVHFYFDDGVKVLKGKQKKEEKPSSGAF